MPREKSKNGQKSQNRGVREDYGNCGGTFASNQTHKIL